MWVLQQPITFDSEAKRSQLDSFLTIQALDVRLYSYLEVILGFRCLFRANSGWILGLQGPF